MRGEFIEQLKNLFKEIDGYTEAQFDALVARHSTVVLHGVMGGTPERTREALLVAEEQLKNQPLH